MLIKSRQEDRCRRPQGREPYFDRKDCRWKGQRWKATGPNFKGIQVLPIRRCSSTKSLAKDQRQDRLEAIHHPRNRLDLAQRKVQRKEGRLPQAARLWSFACYRSFQVGQISTQGNTRRKLTYLGSTVFPSDELTRHTLSLLRPRSTLPLFPFPSPLTTLSSPRPRVSRPARRDSSSERVRRRSRSQRTRSRSRR